MVHIPTFQVFGSSDSADTDIVIFTHTIPSIKESADECKHWSVVLQQTYYPKCVVNPNLAVVTNGIITDVFKGTKDELNNALYTTYVLHHQYHPLYIQHTVARDLPLKMMRCARVILSYITQSPIRAVVKSALRGDFDEKLQALKMFNPAYMSIYTHDHELANVKKTFAFQLGQTLALTRGHELYTKQQIAEYAPSLAPYLSRAPQTPWSVLEEYIRQFIVQGEQLSPSMSRKFEYK